VEDLRFGRRLGVTLGVLVLVGGGVTLWAWNTGKFVAGPCRALHEPINDQMVVRVGDARTWGPTAVGEVRYPGYADSDKLAVCLQRGGQVTGILLRDGKQITMWHQTPDDALSLPS
jgi:hypothetical protein